MCVFSGWRGIIPMEKTGPAAVSPEKRSVSAMPGMRNEFEERFPFEETEDQLTAIRDVKEDMAFRRYSYRGIENVTAQSVILAIAHNVNKFHNKIQSDKTGQHLFDLKKSA